MRVLTWNCSHNLRKKYDGVKKFDADILIVQECEQMSGDLFSGFDFHWVGDNSRMGLGVFTRGIRSSLDPSYESTFKYFLPLEMGSMRILGVWAFHHRAKRFGLEAHGYPSRALAYYRDWLNQAERGVVAGDFNGSTIWDKPRGKHNFRTTVDELSEIGYRSAYHLANNQLFGNEFSPTLFHTKKADRPFHIDYIFSKGLGAPTVEVGESGDWLGLSDHFPVVANFEVSAN